MKNPVQAELGGAELNEPHDSNIAHLAASK